MLITGADNSAALDFQRNQKAFESCRFCMEAPKFHKQLVVSLGHKVRQCYSPCSMPRALCSVLYAPCSVQSCIVLSYLIVNYNISLLYSHSRCYF